mmetsp:Transcript_35800/g.114697  ORF Transcript_35800/g.114697 Transcript_35800/m.114697 type:complete len:207 (+) Transcript_35800:224-844(+)
MGDSLVPKWPSRFHCFDGCRCGRDMALCCYGFLCWQFAWAELMEALDEPAPCCPNARALNSFACAWCVTFAQQTLGWARPPVFVVPALFFGPFVFAEPRRAIGKRGLPVDACCCPYGAHFLCGPCALYQELVFAKHALKKDFHCCCYVACAMCVTRACANVCDAPEPGDYLSLLMENQEPNRPGATTLLQSEGVVVTGAVVPPQLV